MLCVREMVVLGKSCDRVWSLVSSVVGECV